MTTKNLRVCDRCKSEVLEEEVKGWNDEQSIPVENPNDPDGWCWKDDIDLCCTCMQQIGAFVMPFSRQEE